MNSSVRFVRLAASSREGGLFCGSDGLMLTGRPLLRETETGFVTRSPLELQRIFDSVYGQQFGLEARTYLPGLAGVARALNKNDVPLAMISGLLLKLPEVPDPPVDQQREDDGNLKEAFNQDQPRDEHGRWTQGPASGAKQPPPGGFIPDESLSPISPQAAEAGATEAEGLATSLETIAPEVVGLLARLSGIIAAPIAFAAAILLPTNRSNIHSGAFPGFPGLTYRSDEGIVTISRLDAAGNVEDLYRGFPDAEGFYHNDQGQIIGRRVGTGVLIDNDTLAELSTKPIKSLETGINSAPIPDASPKQGDDEPKACPPPTPESIAGRSARSLAYQNQITGLPIGWDVVFRGVRFDGCVDPEVRLKEAKGPMPEFYMKMTDEKLRNSKLYRDVMDQARRQSAAAAGYRDDWYFADEHLATFFSKEFSGRFPNLSVHHEEALVKATRWLLNLAKKYLNSWGQGLLEPSLRGVIDV